ncbi:DUF4314 domain-containing protein [Nocardia sp. alder85J]|uniref:DUF4314 domain-containing protein n=1 Tax=Nocardia sp. alder85J TaxID=2862949 RepID=UPI001CD5612F|nr:DUF4314 domain-containing protein [Nocardia sp. alder85J]MCX4094525.1 DUF4314 domain-containing protein [Nocardia sp. alder85J]
MARLPKAGDRVRMTGVMPGDPDPLDIGETGTVTGINELAYERTQIFVNWDSGRGLILLEDDPFEIL